MISKGCLVRIRPDILLAMYSGKEIFVVISDVCVDERQGFPGHFPAGTVGAMTVNDGVTHRLFVHDLEVISAV